MTQVTSVGGYEEMAIEIFYDSLVEFLESLPTLTPDSMHSELTQENATSDYCTWYLRVLTATYLKSDPIRFLPYLEDGYMDIAAFCQAQIEPMGKECRMVQVLALAEAFQIQVQIEYLDGHEFQDNKLTKHTFGPESSSTQLTLLYRPGHYDILYPK
jgi:ubiquitin thioesterase protein OTUB1